MASPPPTDAPKEQNSDIKMSGMSESAYLHDSDPESDDDTFKFAQERDDNKENASPFKIPDLPIRPRPTKVRTKRSLPAPRTAVQMDRYVRHHKRRLKITTPRVERPFRSPAAVEAFPLLAMSTGLFAEMSENAQKDYLFESQEEMKQFMADTEAIIAKRSRLLDFAIKKERLFNGIVSKAVQTEGAFKG